MVRDGRPMGMDGAREGSDGRGSSPFCKTGMDGCLKSFISASPFGSDTASSYCCKERPRKQAGCDPQCGVGERGCSLSVPHRHKF